MTVKVRFAPSPTGFLHVGNMRTALVNWLYAKREGGEFLLRMDDTDTERSRPEFEAAITEDMGWLGLTWDGDVIYQSKRLGEYEKAKQQLIASGRLYPCYETQEELDIRRKMQASRGLPPIYDRAALKLSAEEKQKLEAAGKKPHYRFLLEDKDVQWDDMIRGRCHYRGSHLSDPVLVREDGVPLYTLASVVDDGQMGITDVVRGEDHVTNTAVQIQIFEALGYKAPRFAHMALIKTKDGELSKRTGGGDIRGLRNQGILPMAINSYLGKIGTSDAIEAFAGLQALAQSFDFKKFGRAPANYDPVDLERLNAKLIHQMDFKDAKAFFAEMNESFWLAVRANLGSFADAKSWWQVLHDYKAPALEEAARAFAASTAAHLPPEPWSEASYDAWMAEVKKHTDRKGKELFMPIRLALTGMEHGPELKKLFPLLGKAKVEERLKGK